MSKLHIIYFSPANSTRNIARVFANSFKGVVVEHDITEGSSTQPVIGGGDLALFAVPVFAGRIPDIAQRKIATIAGDNTPAALICVYGNRDYDDALLELSDTVTKNSFVPLAAAALIARHSVFPTLAAGRPDEQDKKVIANFAGKFFKLAEQKHSTPLQVKGNRPYKAISNIPIKPYADNKCNKCGVCVKACPKGAIPADAPNKTDKKICFSCARCIEVCPQKARRFGGILFWLAQKIFLKKYSQRKEPELFFIDEKI